MDYNIENEIRNRFYIPSVKSVKLYKERIDTKWSKVSFRIKSAFKFISLLAVVGLTVSYSLYV